MGWITHPCRSFKGSLIKYWCAWWTWWRHQMETFSALLAISAGNSPVPVNSPHKGQWRGALMFSLICVWINGWVNNDDAGDLRRYLAHYDVTVMTQINLFVFYNCRYSHIGSKGRVSPILSTSLPNIRLANLELCTSVASQTCSPISHIQLRKKCAARKFDPWGSQPVMCAAATWRPIITWWLLAFRN